MTWEPVRLRHVAHCPVERDGGESRPYIALEHIESKTGRLIDAVEIGARVDDGAALFGPGDVLFGKLRPYLHKVLHPAIEGSCSTELLVIRPHREVVATRFLYYTALSRGFVQWADATSYGTKMPRTSWDSIRAHEFVLPPLPEQRSIADFLDRETARIDELVAKKQRLIELLEEKRTALISHTVTKGLDPTVSMRDSGHSLIGQMPRAWALRPLKALVTKIGSGKTPRGGAQTYVDEGVIFIRSQNVHFDGLMLDDVAFIDEVTDAEMRNTRVRRGDVLLNITGASLGRCCVFDLGVEANVNQHVSILRPRSHVVSDWLAFVLESRSLQTQIQVSQTGAAREGLNSSAAGSLLIPVPPSAEQAAVATQLADACRAAYDTASAIGRQIDLLAEYRQALITAAVTGQIDVSDELADPEEVVA